LLIKVLLTEVLRRVIHSQSPHRPITRLTGRVQHITEVPVPAHRQEVTVHRHQTLTGAVRRQAQEAAVVVTAQEAAAEEAVVHILPVVQAEVQVPEEVQVVAVLGLPVVVHLHLVAGNF
jgi:hypothetical protein